MTTVWHKCVLALLCIPGMVGLTFHGQGTLDHHWSMKAEDICRRRFWMTLESHVKPHTDGTAFVATGDIPDMWIRDSAVQLSPYLKLAQEGVRPIQYVIEGALRSQAKYIVIDPYANSYKDFFDMTGEARLLRGGYVASSNFEMDSGPYFFRLLNDYSKAVPSSKILAEPQMHEACKMLLHVYRVERNHNISKYAYPAGPPYEMPGGPKGKMVGYTGMVWTGFRPSDDPHQFGYNIPGNIFLASQLPFVAHVAKKVWNDPQMAEDAMELRTTILQGVQKFGIHTNTRGLQQYCYEVDGLGKCILEDDANIPSLLSLPHLDPTGMHHDPTIYRNTRAFILSPANPWFFTGTRVRGIGSSHTGANMVWPLALIMEAMTADTIEERTDLVKLVLNTSYGNTLHESINVNNPETIHTRNDFAWPNALFSMLVRDTYNIDCGKKENMPQLPAAIARSSASPQMPHGDFYSADPSKLRYRMVAL